MFYVWPREEALIKILNSWVLNTKSGQIGSYLCDLRLLIVHHAWSETFGNRYTLCFSFPHSILFWYVPLNTIISHADAHRHFISPCSLTENHANRSVTVITKAIIGLAVLMLHLYFELDSVCQLISAHYSVSIDKRHRQRWQGIIIWVV